MKKRMRKDDCRQKCVVYFNLLNVDDFKLREFVTKFINFEDVPVLFISYISRRLRGYCHVPPVSINTNYDVMTVFRFFFFNFHNFRVRRLSVQKILIPRFGCNGPWIKREFLSKLQKMEIRTRDFHF